MNQTVDRTNAICRYHQQSKKLSLRDIQKVMEYPFLALSKNRKKPIFFEKIENDNTITKVIIRPGTDHYIASIYDWDIIIVLVSIYQDQMNHSKDVLPLQRIKIARADLLKRIGRVKGTKTYQDLKNTLHRLQATSIVMISKRIGMIREITTGFSLIDFWSFTEEKNFVELEIKLSDWTYENIGQKGALLKIDPEYLNLTSGLERFLYRTARKYLGAQENVMLLVETLYKKSGSELSIKYFKRDLKIKVEQNKIPSYDMVWIKIDRKEYVSFSQKEKNL